MLQIEAGEVSAVGPDSVEFVVGGYNGGEVKGPILEDDLLPQLVNGLHVLLVQNHLLPLAYHRLLVFIELVAAQVPLFRSQKIKPICPQRQKPRLYRHLQCLVDGHVPGIPQLYYIFVAPLPVHFSLEVPLCLFLESLRLVSDEGVVVRTGSDEGDNLPGLVLDDDGMRGFGLLLVQRKQMFMLLIFVPLEVVHLNVRIIFVVLLVHLPYCCVFHHFVLRSRSMQLGVAIFDHLFIELYIFLLVVGGSFLLNIPVSWAERQPNQIGSEITEKKILFLGVVTNSLELDVIVNLICYFVVVVLRTESLPLQNTLVVDDQLYHHYTV